MDVGVHLPQCRLVDQPLDGAHVAAVADTAREVGLAAVAANDHLAFARPWLDGPTLLAAVARQVAPLDVATTVLVPALRGTAATAAILVGLAALAPGRVVAGLGPGSSAADHRLVGLPVEGRWSRFDHSVGELRALLAGGSPGDDAPALPPPATVPLWVASWGSPRGLRRVAELGDGWLASSYNTTPEEFSQNRSRLVDLISGRRDPLPAAVATMWLYLTDDPARADRVLHDVLAPLLCRDADLLRDRLCVGSPGHAAELLSRYAAAGCSRIHVWPVTDEVRQLQRFAAEVLPAVGA